MKTILLTILVFGIIILLHESGHFILAKLFGVNVEEFSFGMGPKLWSTHRHGTQYSLRAFPIGGYVAMEGEDDAGSGTIAKEVPDFPDAVGDPFYIKSAWQRFIILAAGAVMNILLGFIILLVLTASMELIGTPIVASFSEDAVSAQYLTPGDKVLRINDYAIAGYNDAVFQIFRDEDGIIDFTVLRNGEKVEVSIPFTTQDLGDGMTGVDLDFKFLGQEVTAGNALGYAWQWTVSIAKQVWYSILDIITGRYGLQAISGPVGTATVISQASSQGARTFWLLVSYITINVGVFNLLPLPALDGGRLLFVIIEIVFRRPVPAKYEAWVHRVGIILLLGLIVLITYNDISKLITG